MTTPLHFHSPHHPQTQSVDPYQAGKPLDKLQSQGNGLGRPLPSSVPTSCTHPCPHPQHCQQKLRKLPRTSQLHGCQMGSPGAGGPACCPKAVGFPARKSSGDSAVTTRLFRTEELICSQCPRPEPLKCPCPTTSLGMVPSQFAPFRGDKLQGPRTHGSWPLAMPSSTPSSKRGAIASTFSKALLALFL